MRVISDADIPITVIRQLDPRMVSRKTLDMTDELIAAYQAEAECQQFSAPGWLRNSAEADRSHLQH